MSVIESDSAEPRWRGTASLLVIFAAGLVIYGLRLGDSPLDRTEPFRALVAHQMVKGGDWLIPRLYGEVYLRKPPLIYWIEASVEKVIGHGNEFVWRLPSAVGSAALAVFLAWWAARWFGSLARLPTGFACLALIALWDQNRSADIDALNTAAAMVTTTCVLELICGLRTSTAAWSIGLGLSLGATLLLKGPGGLPQIAAAMIGPAILLGDWRSLRRPAIWIGFLIGFATFTLYVLVAKAAMHRAGITLDRSGQQEIVEKIFLLGWRRRVFAILTPLVLIVYALPVSLVLPFAIATARGARPGDVTAKRARAILGTLVAGALIWILSSNDNPRYEYVMLPLLAPLVGYVWAARDAWDLPRMLLPVVFMLGGAYLLVAWKLPVGITDYRAVWVGGGVVLLILLIWTVGLLKSQPLAGKASGVVVVLLVLLFAFEMGERKNAERRRKSAQNAVAELRRVVGNTTTVSVASVVRDMPELFYYANIEVDSYGEFGVPKLAANARGHWIVLSDTDNYPGYTALIKHVPDAFPRGVTKLHMPDPRDKIYVGWYDPPTNANTVFELKPGQSTETDE